MSLQCEETQRCDLHSMRSLTRNPCIYCLWQASISQLSSDLNTTMKGSQRLPVVQLFDGGLDFERP